MKCRALFVLGAGFTLNVLAAFRPSAVPLVLVDPFFSVWSQADRLSDTDTTHWSGGKQPMSATLSIDGKLYRLMGTLPASTPALPQTGTKVTPLQTVCSFESDLVSATMTFSTAMMPEDLDVFSRPVTYVTLRVRAKDNQPHDFHFSYGIDGAMVRMKGTSPVKAEEMQVSGLVACRIGRVDQQPLSSSGDRVCADWGYAWLATPDGKATVTKNSISLDIGAKGVSMEKHLLLAYDDIDSILFFHQPLKAWWRRNGKPFTTMLGEATADYATLMGKMNAFDSELTADLAHVGGEKYAQIACLAYRHSFAACKLVADRNGHPLYFSKEQTSNGCMGTVDVFYPQSPLLALMSPTLLRATLAPILLYSSSDEWPYPFAPHDVGKYPIGNRQEYGWNSKENRFNDAMQMPVEESGNMLICLGVLSSIEGNADFAGNWWPTITRWAEFLAAKGFDPENQLCTDDFAGHLAHNANLSIKAIMGLACYAKMANLRGDHATSEKYFSLAKSMVPKWMKAAEGGAKGGYRLAFDKEGSWSMKYNLVWDRILGFNLFPEDVAKREMAAYRSGLQNPFGLPLDNRKTYTKSDWLVWTATLTQKREDFEALVSDYHKFIHETPDRLPLSDWYFTDTAKIRGFLARPVIGGVFLPLLYSHDLWKKYTSRDKVVASLYAPLLSPAVTKETPFTVATFNIRCPFDKGDNLWENRLPRILDVIRNRSFSLVGLQEATPKQHADLKRGLPGWASVGRGREADGSGEGMFIFFQTNRFERINDGTFQLSETPDVPGSRSWKTACPRTCTWVNLRDRETGQRFFHFNTHLDHVSEDARRNGMALVLRRVQELAQGASVFLTGDMNSEETTDEKNAIRQAKGLLRDTKNVAQTPHTGNEKTFTGYKEAKITIDYVFASANVHVLAHATCDDMPGGKYPSDHFPVSATVSLPAFSKDRAVYSSIDLLRIIREGKMKENVIPVDGKIHSTIAENFTFEDGVLHILGKGIGYLETPKGYRNYRLIAEYRWGNKQWGSQQGKAFDNGILFHCRGPLGAYSGTWPASFEANIIEGGMGDLLALSCKAKDGSDWAYRFAARAEKDRNGEPRWNPTAPYTVIQRGRLNWEKRNPGWKNVIHTHGPDDPDSPFGQWNTMEVICRDNRVTVFVNGRKVIEACALIPASGGIAIQTEGMETFYRRLELCPLE